MHSRQIAVFGAFLLFVSGCAAVETKQLPPADIVSYSLIDADSGDVIAAQTPDLPMPPASTTKVATSLVALSVLRPNYRFRTQVLVRGTLKDRVLDGDLILVGNGDPLLSAGDLRGLADRVRDVGIDKITGRLLYHSDFPEFARVSSGQPPDAAYNQGISGLNVLFNRAIQIGEKAIVSPPEAAEHVVTSTADTVSRVAVPITNPATVTARLFHRFAASAGIDLPQPERDFPPAGSLILAEVQSQPVSEIVRAGLEYSNNMVAEVLGLASARALGVPTTTLIHSSTGVGLWLENEITELSRFATSQQNHSGLSADARISARQMTMILAHAQRQRFEGWRFSSLLPPGGGPQTLYARFSKPETAYRVWAKSGNMHYIKGLVGYLDSQSGRRLAFAIYTHNPGLRSQLAPHDEHVSIEERRATRVWEQKVSAREHTLLETWITRY